MSFQDLLSVLVFSMIGISLLPVRKNMKHVRKNLWEHLDFVAMAIR